MPHFIYPSVKGHLGHFHFMAPVTSGTMNICVQVLCGHLFSTHLGKYLGGRSLDCAVNYD